MHRLVRKPIQVIVFPALLVWSASVTALPEVPDEKGMSGFISFGGGILNLESNTISGNRITDLDNDPLNSGGLASVPSSRTAPIPIVVHEFTWNFGGRNELFVGESIEDAVTLDSGTQLGWRKSTENLGTFQVGLLVNRLVPTEVYEDAFLTGSKRSKTNDTRYGLRFQWDKIFDTAFEWQLTARTVDIENDTNGQSLVIGDANNPISLPTGVNLITANQLALLQRDAEEISTRLSYLIKAGKNHSIRPLIGYKSHDADGDAESFNSIRAQVTYAYQTRQVLFVTNILWADHQFDARNPIYNERRDSKNMAIESSLLVPLDIGNGNWGWFANVLWGREDSDITFYDQEAFRVVTGLQYRFVLE